MKSKIKTIFTVSPPSDPLPEPEIRTVASIGRHEDVFQKSYEFVMHVCFEVVGKNLDSRIVNPLLRKFREQLENFKLYEGQMKCWVVRVTEFEHELINMDRAICSQQILFRAYDPRGFSCESIKPRLLRDMLTQELKDEEFSINIWMTDALYGGSRKSAPWPKNEKGREQNFA